MRPLYDRLKAKGFERSFVLDAVLPDWWDDALFEEPSSRLSAEMSIARFLGVPLQRIVGDVGPLELAHRNVRLKRSRTDSFEGVSGAVSAAMYAAKATAALLVDRLPFTGVRGALQVRSDLLTRTNCGWPDLAGLVDYCWEHGIGVVHVTRLPHATGAKKIVGLATFVDQRPIVVLCSGRDSSAWLAFHLAHELGHIMCSHVKVGDGPVVDVLEDASPEVQEREADQYAFEVLTGEPNPRFAGDTLRGPALARAARTLGEKNQIYPGTVALIYGYTKHRMAVAQAALAVMKRDSGAGHTLAESFRRHVPLQDVPEQTQRYLAATTQVYGLTHVATD